jgi:imidazolonepropionase-like amidohydrolase
MQALCLALAPVICAAQPDSQAPSVTAIRAGKFIDVQSGQTLAKQIILVRGAKIEAVGSNLAIPDGATVIDLSNMTVLPGLIDCHTHLADLHDAEPLVSLRLTAAETAYATIPNASVTLLAGFTTVRDVGVYRAFNDVAMRDAIAKGIIIGPRMYVAGAYVTISEGAGAMTGLAKDIELPLDLRYGIANGPWEVRRVVRELAHLGADHIKILTTGAVLTHGSNAKSIEFTPEEIKAAVEEAANFGLRVEAHAHDAQGIKNAIRAGVASIEHATLIDDEGIALAKQHGTYLDMDIYDEECIQAEPALPADFLAHDCVFHAMVNSVSTGS